MTWILKTRELFCGWVRVMRQKKKEERFNAWERLILHCWVRRWRKGHTSWGMQVVCKNLWLALSWLPARKGRAEAYNYTDLNSNYYYLNIQKKKKKSSPRFSKERQKEKTEKWSPVNTSVVASWDPSHLSDTQNCKMIHLCCTDH